jgi:hypothetical protein
VPLDPQVETVGDRCSKFTVVESAIVPRWLNVILDLIGVLRSCIQKSTVTRRGLQQKNYYTEGFVHSATIPTYVGTKAIYVRPSLADFVRRVSEFADIMIWSSMMHSTTKQVVDYLFHNNVPPVAVYGQESCDTIKVEEGKELKYPKSDKSIFLKTLSAQLFLGDASRYKKSNTILIDDSPEKSILNDSGNVVFLKSWKHIVRNSSSDDYLIREVGSWLKRLHTKGQGQVLKYVNNHQLGVNLLVPGDVLYEIVIDGLKKHV